jgi:5-methylthioadenosine/S-adenosylhomocysteine deaminase
MTVRIRLKNATIVTMNQTMQIVRGDVVIENDRIIAVGEHDTTVDREIDCSGTAIIPGFVQTHVHLCQTLMRNSADDMVLIDWLRNRIWPYEGALEPKELHASARLGLSELILGGTTTLLDMATVRHTESVIDAVVDSGIRAFVGKCHMDHPVEVPPSLMENTQDSLREAIRLCEAWDGKYDGRIRYAFAPRFAVSCTEDLLRGVSEAAAELGAFIHTHSSETEFENIWAQENYGCSNIEFLERVGIAGDRSVLAHGVHVTDADIAILKRTKTAIAHCPSSNLKLASGIANIPRFDAAGVKVSLGADGAPCNNNLDAFIEMRLAALIQKPIHGPQAMPAERVLRLATIDGAIALGIDDEVGSIEVGKKADLVVVDIDSDPGTNPAGSMYSRLVYATHRANVRHVFASGRQVVDNRELTCWDVAEVTSESKQAFSRVMERMQD